MGGGGFGTSRQAISMFRLDCTLRELMNLIKDVNPEARRRGTEFNFSVGMNVGIKWSEISIF